MIFKISELGELHDPVGTTATALLELFYPASKNMFLQRKNIFEISVLYIKSYSEPQYLKITKSWKIQIFIDFDYILWFSNIEAQDSYIYACQKFRKHFFLKEIYFFVQVKTIWLIFCD